MFSGLPGRLKDNEVSTQITDQNCVTNINSPRPKVFNPHSDVTVALFLVKMVYAIHGYCRVNKTEVCALEEFFAGYPPNNGSYKVNVAMT